MGYETSAAFCRAEPEKDAKSYTHAPSNFGGYCRKSGFSAPEECWNIDIAQLQPPTTVAIQFREGECDFYRLSGAAPIDCPAGYHAGRGTDQTSYILQKHQRNRNIHCKVYKQWLSTPVQSPMCDTNPCQNGGTCVQGGSASAFTCTCLRGYAGETCEMDACAVASIATVETGTFKGGGDAPGDVCPAGTEPISSFCECKAAALVLGKTFKGETSLPDYTPGCSERINHPSYTGVWFNTNLGTEYDGHNMVGQTAPVCEESPMCDTNPCNNGGTCVQGGSASAFTCTCLRGYAGETCEVDACAAASIANVERGTLKGGGDAPGDVCPVGTEPISSFCECKAAALVLGKTFKGETSLPDYTPGCSERINHPSYTGVWFNTNLGTE